MIRLCIPLWSDVFVVFVGMSVSWLHRWREPHNSRCAASTYCNTYTL